MERQRLLLSPQLKLLLVQNNPLTTEAYLEVIHSELHKGNNSYDGSHSNDSYIYRVLIMCKTLHVLSHLMFPTPLGCSY